jgi:hypothetical protein
MKSNVPSERFLPEDCAGGSFILKLPGSISDLSSPTLTNTGTLLQATKLSSAHCTMLMEKKQDPTGRKRMKMWKSKICIEQKKET